jgi:hypothetical protein
MEKSGQLHASDAFTPKETAPGTHCIGGRMGPRAGLDATENKEISCYCWESNSSCSAIQPIAHNSLVSILAQNFKNNIYIIHMLPHLLMEGGRSDDYLLTLLNIKGHTVGVVYMLSRFHNGECSDYGFIDCCTV